MKKRFFAGLVGMLMSCNAVVAQGNSNVNVNVTTQTLFADAFMEVILSGAGGGTVTFPDLATAPNTSADALALALLQLSLAPDQALSNTVVTGIGTESVVATVFSSDYNPTDNPGLVLGDPDDYATWIAIGAEDILVQVDLITTEYALYSVSADIAASVAAVPLPASGLLLLAALGGGGAWARRKRA